MQRRPKNCLPRLIAHLPLNVLFFVKGTAVGLEAWRGAVMKSALSVIVAVLVMECANVLAYPVATTFTISPSQSNLTVNASSAFFSDTDTNSLSGTIDAIFDFGEGGAFP